MRRGLAPTATSVLMTLAVIVVQLAQGASPAAAAAPPTPGVKAGAVSSWIVTLDSSADPKGAAAGLAGTAAQAQALAKRAGVRHVVADRYYIIRAVNAVGVGAPSTEVSAIAR